MRENEEEGHVWEAGSGFLPGRGVTIEDAGMDEIGRFVMT